MNTSHLPYIVAIASAGSLSAASRQLGVSQSTLSKHLKKLEQEVGLELFFHNQKQYVPTPAGRLYIQTAQRILEQLRHAKASIAALDCAEIERLRVGLSPNRGISIMAQVFPDFDNHYPQVRLELYEGYANRLKELLNQRKLDIVLSTHTGTVPSGLDIIPIHAEELVLAVPVYHPAVRHDTFTLDELPYADLNEFRDSVFLLPDSTSTLYALIQFVFAENHFTPQVITTTPNIVMQEALIQNSGRVGFLPAYYIRPNSGIAYFRLRASAQLILVCITRVGHIFTSAERFLLYLVVRRHLHSSDLPILWNDFLQGLLWEFDPIEAAAQRLEVPNGS